MRSFWDGLPGVLKVVIVVLVVLVGLWLIQSSGSGGGGYDDCGADYGFTTGC